jgi:adenylate cyclase class 2
VPFEAELTAVVTDPDRVRAALSQRAPVEPASYADTYYDYPDLRLEREGYELRVRTVTTATAGRVMLTYKEPPVPGGQGAKPEHETTVADAGVLHTMLRGIGLLDVISFTKHCENYRFVERGRELLATLVRVPDLGDQTFIELETAAEPDDVPAALEEVRAVLVDLGVRDDDLTTETYTSRVAAARADAD